MTIEEDADGIRVQAGKQLNLLVTKAMSRRNELESIRDLLFVLRALIEADDGTIFQLPKDLDHINLRVTQFRAIMQQLTNSIV